MDTNIASNIEVNNGLATQTRQLPIRDSAWTLAKIKYQIDIKINPNLPYYINTL